MAGWLRVKAQVAAPNHRGRGLPAKTDGRIESKIRLCRKNYFKISSLNSAAAANSHQGTLLSLLKATQGLPGQGYDRCSTPQFVIPSLFFTKSARSSLSRLEVKHSHISQKEHGMHVAALKSVPMFL
ncbi:hypothetical protein CIHG_06314 [Coccidioides immitis H538.4]|uniref:Uncharacterized protein n=3 Tax=Coccidioides immitis TaxID=5501 RepID=A0A0J8QVL9_COCIT|nr:hypothetical protein CIRG_09595 [Coccidioides immitis RMSCC 2394]KMU75358.1 hypothetical protein CISG_04777 [Coccidioides immitis RMSCC 3703]KMU88514.1 hypothetical protein CIHG_06314 [Coccidioides immitis H538.4]